MARLRTPVAVLTLPASLPDRERRHQLYHGPPQSLSRVPAVPPPLGTRGAVFLPPRVQSGAAENKTDFYHSLYHFSQLDQQVATETQ